MLGGVTKQMEVKQYQLLNKDFIIANFHIEGHIEGTGILENIVIDNFNSNQHFKYINEITLPTFLLNRRAPNSRENMSRLLQQSGFNRLSKYFDITHSVSLTDTLWVQGLNQGNLNWKDVNPYKKKFNSKIAKTALDGGKYGKCLTDISPEYSTNGTFAKCWIRENGVIKLAKKGSSGASNSGLEPYSEFYTSQIFDEYGINHAKYGLGRIGEHKSLVSKSTLFTSEDIGLIPISAFKPNSMTDIIKIYQELGLVNELAEMLILDSVVFNQDRHLGNFGLLVDNNTGGLVGAAPIYDHNISLLCYATDFDIANSINFNNYCLENNIGPKLYSGNFVDFAKQLLEVVDTKSSSNIKRKLQRIQDIKIKKHTKYNLSDVRIHRIEELIHNQIKLILKK